ncbi:outer membrane protein assembly factor BamB [SAR86 cluster bacterium]|nr:outer membrane protein assembly factor BamB [SAR86 cluster bacterium]
MLKNLSIIFLSFLMISCQSDSKEEEKPAELNDIQSKVFFEKSWSKKILSDFPLGDVDLAFNQNNIFIFTEQGEVSALDFTGDLIWKKSFNDQISAGLGYGFESIFFATENGKIISLNAKSGEKIWESRVNGEVLSSPSTNGLIVAVQSSNGKITALDFNDGNFKWEYQSTVSPLSLRGTSKPVFDKKFIYVGFGNGNLVKIESRTGVVQWEVPVTLSDGVSEIERMIDVEAMPVISPNGLAYAVTFQGDLSAVEIVQGRTVWRSSASSTKDILHTKNKTYIVDSEDLIKSYDGIKGNSLWNLDDFKLRKLSSPKKFKDHMIVGDYEGYLHAVNLNNGEIEGRFRPSNQAIYEIYAFNNFLYVLDESGKISTLKIK